MDKPIVRVSHLSKRYRIGATQVRYRTIRESLANSLRRLTRSAHSTKPGFIWALDDISFDIYPGQAVGIIGRNGAGKSTLLKLLSHITIPSCGRIELQGRVGSLLEIGTGFHHELTGRENIFLNGAILGMRRSEIRKKFDEIVAFSEIDKFIDTPVKHYSSGMYMRLAFSVAAHLDPDILLVDEVLAVGDVAFQKKCLGKMGDVANQGRTILFVSHNMSAISKLCQSCILLSQGRIILIDTPEVAIKKYLDTVSSETTDWKDRIGSHRVMIDQIEVLNELGQKSTQLTMGQPITIKVLGHSLSNTTEFTSAIQIVSSDGTILMYGSDQYAVLHPKSDKTFCIKLSIDALMLMPGEYFLNVWIGQEGIEEFDYIKSAVKLTVSQGGDLPIIHPLNTVLGQVFIKVHVEEVI
ncbi:MAG TPA: ABC transporter ATP-binding protein [Anaerolineaceae bacterium]|nr:ABC transporter ATP-binding protein [Anaerolineaceae bacterium]